jgi:S-adenosylmethionine:tRNA ribosyltransferase-isomerase
LATQRLGASSRLRVVDAILSGTHERGTSHYELLRAFVDNETLSRIDHELDARDYRTHEFGDSVFLERAAKPNLPRSPACRSENALPHSHLLLECLLIQRLAS